jgi:hypothetical protein
MITSGRRRVLVAALQAAILVSLFAGPAVNATEPTGTDAVPVVTAEPSAEPVVDPGGSLDPEPDITPTTEPAPAEEPSPTGIPSATPTAPAGEPQVAPEVAPAYVGTIDTTTTLDVDPAEVAPGASVTLTATVTPDPGCGSVRFTYNGASVDVPLGAGGDAQTTVVALAGTTPAAAEFLGCGEFSSSTGTADVRARAASTATLVASHTTAIRYEETVTLTGTVSGPFTPTGSVTFVRTDTQASLGTAALVNGTAVLARADFPVGTYEIVLRFPGDAQLRPSESAPVTLTITADPGVKVSNVGVQWLRLYPVKDGYKDTDQVFGTTLEPATVTIRIYNSGGTRVKDWALGTKNGSYAVTWTGRKADGSLLAAGTYQVKQFFEDASGNTKTVTSEVILSHKKLYWYVKSQTRYASTGAFFTADHSGAYKSDRFYRGIELDGGWYAGQSALARYTFTLPSATIYSSVRVSVYGKSISPYGKGNVSFRNWSTGIRDGITSIGYSTAWYEKSVSATNHVNSDRAVRVYVEALGATYSLVDFQKVKLTYKYAVLK